VTFSCSCVISILLPAPTKFVRDDGELEPGNDTTKVLGSLLLKVPSERICSLAVSINQASYSDPSGGLGKLVAVILMASVVPDALFWLLRNLTCAGVDDDVLAWTQNMPPTTTAAIVTMARPTKNTKNRDGFLRFLTGEGVKSGSISLTLPWPVNCLS